MLHNVFLHVDSKPVIRILKIPIFHFLWYFLGFFPYNSKTRVGRHVLITDFDSTPQNTYIRK